MLRTLLLRGRVAFALAPLFLIAACGSPGVPAQAQGAPPPAPTARAVHAAPANDAAAVDTRGSRTAQAASASAAGRWKGAIELPGQQLEIDVTLTRSDAGTWSGTISIPAQGAKDLALADVVITDDSAKFAIAGIPGEPSFDGKLTGLTSTGAKLAGTFTQGGQALPFALERALDAVAESAQALDGFGEWLDSAREAWKTPGVAVALVHDGETVFVRGSGLADVDAQRPVTPDTLFAIGSSTKAFTTFVLGTLVDEGKLGWDDRVRKHLPEFRVEDAELSELLTVRDLVSHRSGLPRHDLVWYNSPDTRPEMVARIAHLPASADLRTKFQYNNLMFLTAGYLAERLAGKAWEELVRERIFAPLGMTRSNFAVANMARDLDHAEPYALDDDAVKHLPMRKIDAVGPAGSINSSVNEMANWVKLQLAHGKRDGRELVQAGTLAEMHTVVTPLGGADPSSPETIPVGYALGWFVEVYRGHLHVHHGGNIDGYSALVALLPQDDWGIVVLTNQNGSALPELVARHAFDRVLGLERTDWSGKALAMRDAAKAKQAEGKEKQAAARKTGTSPSHPLADYAGEYAHPGYGVVEVTLEGDKLKAELHGLQSKLEHWHYDVFSAHPETDDEAFEDLQLQFTSDFGGDIDGLRVVLDPTLPATRFARQAEAELRDPAFLARYEGDYELEAGVSCSIRVKGDDLTALVPGQPTYTLVPKRRDAFDLKGLEGFSLRFVSEEGRVNAVEFHQPNGVFTAKRK
ncbi:MAG: serine hydrolase [Planctomycetes bacterium]|nr:serine hydrolase [Planctomycetota bacterium]